jgi:PAS domain S-box-containing protein
VILDSQHRIVAANQSVLRVSGLSNEEILGRFCYEVYHDRGMEGPASGCPMVRLLSSGHTETCPMEMEAFGGVYLVSCTPVFDDAGRLGRVIHIATDITDRVRMEEALRRSEETYRRIAENMADVVWVTDLDLRVTYVSPSVEKLIGESVESHMKRSMEEKFTPESLERIRSALLEELAREGDPHVDPNRTRLVEAEHYRADGQTVWIAMNVFFVRDAAGRRWGLQGVTRDITERRH